jgi:oxalate decarboxylase/phosphoglucose isomerase-like protein (cupin superfamily)
VSVLSGEAQIVFFNVYTKAKSENLTPDQERRLRAAVETIKREFRNEN